MATAWELVFLITGINGCATGLDLHQYIAAKEWLPSTGTGFLMTAMAEATAATTAMTSVTRTVAVMMVAAVTVMATVMAVGAVMAMATAMAAMATPPIAAVAAMVKAVKTKIN